jgi:hypothetical protein
MPSIANWFSGAAFAAFVVFVGAGYGWYRAALSEMQSVEKETSAKTQAGETARSNVLQRLTQEYILSHDGISSGLLAGTERPPSVWMNKRLQELGYSWRIPN